MNKKFLVRLFLSLQIMGCALARPEVKSEYRDFSMDGTIKFTGLNCSQDGICSGESDLRFKCDENGRVWYKYSKKIINTAEWTLLSGEEQICDE